MDGGRSQTVQWRSSIPGVSQREGSPATLGIAAWGMQGGGADAPARNEWAAGGEGSPSEEGPRRSGPAGPARGPRRRPWRALALAGLALVAVLGVARLAGADASLEPAAVPISTAHTAAPDAPDPRDALGAQTPDWWEVLAELDRRRARALSSLDPNLLTDYAQSGSAAWSADAALIADLRERGVRPQGLTSRVLAVERAQSQGEQFQVQVVDQRSAYTLVDDRGSIVERVAAAGLTRWAVTLVADPRGAPGWRVVDVSASQGIEGAGTDDGSAAGGGGLRAGDPPAETEP